ncbi:hypothetical protein F6I42_03465 [Corynebacterium amycolatum]|uniref:hypothetical protein n=1 Tax=Corynebacterium amycolatum TaxID=43765 RepID=UPI0012445645|nr:hypothetical protein [Corynebacterium amycolatum]KAA9227044.1 hypothetical protein F6I42_03465 [Corynebacterium amycolatum]
MGDAVVNGLVFIVVDPQQTSDGLELTKLLLTGVTAAFLTQILAWAKDAWQGRAEKREKQRAHVVAVLDITGQVINRKLQITQEVEACRDADVAATIMANRLPEMLAPLQARALEIVSASLNITNRRVYVEMLALKESLKSSQARLTLLLGHYHERGLHPSPKELARGIRECFDPIVSARSALIKATQTHIAPPRSPAEWLGYCLTARKRRSLGDSLDSEMEQQTQWLSDFIQGGDSSTKGHR